MNERMNDRNRYEGDTFCTIDACFTRNIWDFFDVYAFTTYIRHAFAVLVNVDNIVSMSNLLLFVPRINMYQEKGKQNTP